jgi:hypothetical protein
MGKYTRFIHILQPFLAFMLLFFSSAEADQCPRGFYYSNGKCLPVQIPENAQLNVYGNGWDCKRGFYKLGDKCLPVQIPENAELSPLGNGWQCRQGFKKVESKCVPMTAQELKEQQEKMKQILQQIQKKRVYVQNKCDAAYNRCVRECEGVSIYSYETGNYISAGNTDFPDKCESACKRGRRYCEDEDPDEQCYEFMRACRNDCPSDVYLYRSGKYLISTDAEDQCEDACRSGER